MVRPNNIRDESIIIIVKNTVLENISVCFILNVANASNSKVPRCSLNISLNEVIACKIICDTDLFLSHLRQQLFVTRG